MVGVWDGLAEEVEVGVVDVEVGVRVRVTLKTSGTTVVR